MIQHIVLLQPKSDTTEEQAERALLHVQEMKEKIPGIVEIATGGNLNSDHAKQYPYGFVITFKDEHFQGYANHPAHLPISEELQNLFQNIIDFDLKVGE